MSAIITKAMRSLPDKSWCFEDMHSHRLTAESAGPIKAEEGKQKFVSFVTNKSIGTVHCGGEIRSLKLLFT